MTFVFRNTTIERFLPDNCQVSGYQDISQIPADATDFVWWYQMPFHHDVNALIAEIESYKSALSLVLNQLGGKPIILVTIGLIYEVANTMSDERALAEAIQDYNAYLFHLTRQSEHVKVVDIRPFYGGYPQAELIDWKFYMMGQVGLNPRLASAFKSWWQHEMDALALKRKKCLVLDLDNTLWSGILGEDGVDGIQMSGDYPGKAFHLWQEGLKELQKNGVILCICSKNNEQDVLDVWAKRSDMVLRREDFAAWRINWQDKATNLRELAEELNIGLDSMVFVDDNPSERELIRQMLPMVCVPDWINQPYELPVLYRYLVENYFRVNQVTDEDRSKTLQYHQNAERRLAQTQFANITEFIASLSIRLTIGELTQNDGARITRAAQMTQKTNQFNLTTKRYEEADIQRLILSGASVWTLDVADRFGDYGMVGLLIESNGEIDTMLLSCRVLGKGIEEAFVKEVLRRMHKQKGINGVVSRYIPTAKNTQVADFWEKVGFSLIQSSSAERLYNLDLSAADLLINDYYTIVE